MLQFQHYEMHDGTHIRIHGVGPSFDVCLGTGKVGKLNDDKNHLFTIEGSSGHYLTQILFREFELTKPNVDPMDILGWFMRTEVDYEREHLGALPLEKEWLKGVAHQTGMPIISWLRRVKNLGGGPSQATSYAVHTALVHCNKAIVSITSTGMNTMMWTERDLQTQALRIPLSYALC